MGMLACSGAQISCTFGLAPSTLTVLPVRGVSVNDMPAATIMDHQPMVNIAPFGACTSLANPQVASATAAALGALTPQPCIPMTQTPWTPGAPTVLIGNSPALTVGSTCMCLWAGVISIVSPGQTTVNVG